MQRLTVQSRYNVFFDNVATMRSSLATRGRSVSFDPEDGTVDSIPYTKPRSQSVSDMLEDPSSPLSLMAATDPSFLMLQFGPYPSLSYATLQESPRLVAIDDAILRAVSVLDRTPISDLHKIGIVYAGSNQTTESKILQNTHGSRNYSTYLGYLGRFFKLKDAVSVYTGGLDTGGDFDGPVGLYYMQDQRMEQVIFHAATLMPTLDKDLLCTGKKRHIGNDYVSIVWNESGYLYNHDTIPGQFNFVLVVIEPVPTRSRQSHASYETAIFRVYLSTRQDLPEPKPQAEASKLVLGASLAAYTRQLAVQANMYCHAVAAGDNELMSNARERLAQLKRLGARIPAAETSETLDFTRNLS